MSMGWSLEIPSDLEQRIAAEAHLRGLEASEYALKILESSVPESHTQPMSGRDLVEFWREHGLIGDWAARNDISDSSEYARKLRERAQQRDAS